VQAMILSRDAVCRDSLKQELGIAIFGKKVDRYSYQKYN